MLYFDYLKHKGDVMSKAAKATVFILAFLLLAVGAACIMTVLEKQKVEESNLQLNQELSKEKKLSREQMKDIKRLEGDLKTTTADKKQLEKELARAQNKQKELNTTLVRTKDELDNITERKDRIQEERDRALDDIQSMELQHRSALERVRKDVAQESEAQIAALKRSLEQAQEIAQESPRVEMLQHSSSNEYALDRGDSSIDNEAYWASVLRDKASLEIKIEELNEELSAKSLAIVELTRSNDDLSSTLGMLRHDKEEIEREIKYKNDLINNLSLELARTKNDKKFVADRVAKLNNENKGIRQEVKKLAASRNALEKSILQVTQQKTKMEKELGKTESIVQSKIDEIWDIKQSLDKTMRAVSTRMPENNTVELSPIIVNADSRGVNFDAQEMAPRISGSIVSINKENNFVIVDLGEASGLQLGDVLNVYRDTKYIARLEVIQVRKDISAADIKDQWSQVRVGDSIQ